MHIDADFAVVGGGIIGLATAHKLQTTFPSSHVVVVESESNIATHQTGHNSGVIHAGVYYRPGSLKATLCRTGRAELLEYCSEHNIAVSVSGKLIVAVRDDELGALATLEERARQNGLNNVARLGTDGFRDVEPAANGVAALHIPETGVVDFSAVSDALRDDIEKADGEVITDFSVTAIREELGAERLVAADERSVRAKTVVVCAGLQTDRLLRMRTGEKADTRIVPFRGSYLELTGMSASLVKSMIYPVPDPRFPFLGVHYTRHIDNSVGVGPNAVLALARSTYERGAVHIGDVVEALGFSGFRKLAKTYWRAGANEIADDVLMRRYIKKARAYVPDVRPSDFRRGAMGIRAQAVTAAGALVDDFVFRTVGNATFVLNAPSPGATASLAIGSHIVSQLNAS